MTDPTPTEPPVAAPPTERTRLGGKWLGKTLIFMLVLIGFGFWGFYDATVVYPARGEDYAEFAKWQYLQAARANGTLYSASVADPAGTYTRLEASRNSSTALADVALYNWLDGLQTLGRLTPDRTKIEQPESVLADLDKRWATKNPPKPLAKYDLPVQWVFVVVGLGGGLALLALVIQVKARTYRWDPAAQRLTLPDGSTLVPADIAEFDKRKWDKFLIFLKVKPGHPRHGGKELKLDLYRYVPLEEWVLAMERTAYPEHAAPAPEPTAEPAETPAPGS